MAEGKTRGLSAAHELNEEFLYRDTRSMVTKAFDWLRIPANMALCLGAHVFLVMAIPSVGDLILVSALLLTLWAMTRKEECPIKMPIQSRYLDPNQPHPANGRPMPAAGIFFLGNETKSGKEIWLTNNDCRQHFLVLGTTGAGKTETLLGFATNALSWGSGFLFCDGKGDVALFAKVYALARRFGREDDLLVLNFMTGNQDLGTQGGKVLSNTLNPFAIGSSDSLTQMVVGLMDEVGGDGAMWKGRATAMFTGVMRALTWLRDHHIVDLNIGEIRDHLNLRRIIDLADASKFPDMPQQIRRSIKSYLSSLPGYQEEKGYKQSQTTLDQHGYLEMQFTKILGSLADVYGHIFHTPYGEVDMHDVVLNRRILVIMLPALEKSGDEIANLGKIVVATLKGMMGATLGSQIEGDWEHVVENRPYNSPSPFLVVLDEVGYYTVEGMALMAAQARGLGFSMVYASQDIPAMLRLNDKEAKSIIANTNSKIFMRTEEAAETGKLAVDSGGKGMRTQVRSFSGHSGEASLQYRDSMEAGIETVDKVNFTDLKSQSEGEMTITFQDKVIRAKSFYANPEAAVEKRSLTLRANHFIKVAKPDPEELETARRAPELMERLIDQEFARRMVAEEETARGAVAAGVGQGDEIAIVADTLQRLLDKRKKPVDSACAAIANLARVQKGATSAFAQSVKSAADFVDDLSRDIDLDGEFASALDDVAKGQERSRPTGARVEDEIMLGDDMPPDFDVNDDGDTETGPSGGTDVAEATDQGAKASHIRSDVQHGVSVDEGPLVGIANRIASNDSVMRALASLDFDGEKEEPETVESAIQDALGAEATAIENSFEAIEREALAAADAEVGRAVAPQAKDNHVEEEVKAERPSQETDDGLGEGMEADSTSPIDFLQSLLDE